MHILIEPGFFSSGPVRTAVVVGSITAVVSAIVGIFTVVRSQSFAGHALTDVATTGGAAAYFFGLGPLVGFIGGGVVGAGAMDLAGVQRVRSRDLATGVVLGAATGLAALFLYLDTTTSATTGATQQILFGSIFTVEPSTIPFVVVLSALDSDRRDDDPPPTTSQLTLPGASFSTRSADSWDWSGIHVGNGCCRGLVVDRDRRDPLDSAIDRSCSHCAAPNPVNTQLTRRCQPSRRGDDSARNPLRVRQQLLGPIQSGTAGQLLHRGYHLHRLSHLGPAGHRAPRRSSIPPRN